MIPHDKAWPAIEDYLVRQVANRGSDREEVKAIMRAMSHSPFLAACWKEATSSELNKVEKLVPVGWHPR